MSIFFIESRYKKLIERASALRYEFNADTERETPLRETIELFINEYTSKPWPRFLSFIPFRAEYTARKLTAKYIDDLEFYVTCAPVTMKAQENMAAALERLPMVQDLRKLLTEKDTQIGVLENSLKSKNDQLRMLQTKQKQATKKISDKRHTLNVGMFARAKQDYLSERSLLNVVRHVLW